MEGCCESVKIEAVGDSPTDQLNATFCCLKNISQICHGRLGIPCDSKTDTSSIALTNYDIVRTSEFSTPTFDDSLHIKDAFLMRDSLLLSPFRKSTPTLFDSLHIKDAFLMQDSLSFRFPFQRSSVETVSCLEYCSQATACIATSFGECGLYTTALDKLQYIYSYIYIQFSSNATTTTICYGIYIFLNSRHTGPLRLLPSVKHTATPSASLPLFTTRSFTTSSSTTRSTLQLSILLESTSAPSLSITSGTFFVNLIKSIIFLSLAGVDNEDDNHGSPTGPDIRCDFESRSATVMMTTHIYSEQLPSSSSSILWLNLRCANYSAFIVIFFLFPVGAVGRDNDFHLINHVKANTVSSTAVTILTTVFDVRTGNNDLDLYFTTVFDGRTGNDDNNFGVLTVSTSNIVMLLQLGFSCGATHIFWSQQLKISNSTYIAPSTVQAIVTTIFRSRRFKLLSSVSNYAMAAISISLINSPLHIIDHGSLVYLIHLQIRFYDQQDSLSWLENNNGECDINNTDGRNDNASFSPVSVANEATFAATIDNITSCFGDNNDSFGRVGDNTAISVADEATFPTATVTMPTPVYSLSSSSSSSELSNNYMTFSAVTDAVTRTTTSYTSFSSHNNVNNSSSLKNNGNDSPETQIADALVHIIDQGSDQYSLYFDTTFDTLIDTAFTSSSHVSPSYDIDSSPSAIGSSIVRTIVATIFISNARNGSNNSSLFIIDGRTGNNDNNYGDITVSNYIIVTLKTYNTIYELHFDTVIAIIVAAAPAVAVGAPSVIKMKTYATIFITLLCLHIIDQGSVLYLIQQILLYNQQYVFLCAAVTTDMTCNIAVLVITKIFSAIYDEDSSVFTIVTTAVTMTTVFHELPSAIHDGLISAGNDSPATETTTTQVYLSSSSSSSSEFYAIYDEDSSAGNDSPLAITMKTRVTSSTIHTFLSIPNAESNTTAIIMMTTAFHEPPSAIHNGIFSAVADAPAAVTIMTTAVKMMTNDMNTAVYFAFIDTESSADITNTITSYASPSYDIDTESSTVPVADEATSAVSCHSSNYFSLISSRQFEQITSVLSTLMSLHRALHLILTSLLILIQ